MREVMQDLAGWWQAGATVGMSTVVQIHGSSPREPGASLVVGPLGEVVGSVSGGCVEAAVYELSKEAAATGIPALVRYGVSGGDPYAPGLICGGALDVFASQVSTKTFPGLDTVMRDVHAGRPVAVATIVEHPDAAVVGRRLVVRRRQPDMPSPNLAAAGSYASHRGRIGDSLIADARGLLAVGRSQCLSYGPMGERRGEGMRVFVQSFAPPPRMLVFGAIDYAAAVAKIGSFLGYRVTVCDARPLFATPDRFPDAAEVVVDWPHRYLQQQAETGNLDSRTVICVLTHDPKFDVPVLSLALRLPVAYVGAMGSRQTHVDRLERLRAAGLTESELSRLSSPVGLDLGGRTPEETAVSIAAEIIAARSGASGARLRDLDQPIHLPVR
ncbi:MAG TPA: XdhC/CoxI family protein [Propionibacteriaceae bacterium]|nr:XdhC/CoxI family protein [Propionibacteriaceae bacterium]